jgi:hypothetical protein
MTTEQIRAFQERILPYLERTQDKEELLQVCEMAVQAHRMEEPKE